MHDGCSCRPIVFPPLLRQDGALRASSTMAAPTQPPPRAQEEPQTVDVDVSLIHAARAGDRQACYALWSKYTGLVQRLVRRFLGPGPDYQDVCQEAFLRIFKRLGELREPAGLSGFVVSVTLGVARNEYRRRRIRSIVGLVPEEALPEPSSSLLQNEAREVLRALYRMLDSLGSEDRSLFVSRFVEKMELVEVATVHGMSLSTVKRRLARLETRVGARVRSNPVLAEYAGLFGQGETP